MLRINSVRNLSLTVIFKGGTKFTKNSGYKDLTLLVPSQ
jgi:hypothetical protein